MSRPYRFYLGGVLLENNPTNYNSIVPSFQRDDKYRGVFVDYKSTTLQLVKDAKNIADADWAVDNVEAETSLRKEAFIDNAYETTYEASLDYGLYKKKEVSTDVGIRQEGTITDFKLNDDVDINLQSLVDLKGNAITPFTNETIQINLTPQILRKNKFISGTEDTSFNSEPLINLNVNIIDYTSEASNRFIGSPTVDMQFGFPFTAGNLDIENFNIPIGTFENSALETKVNPAFSCNERGSVILILNGTLNYRIGFYPTVANNPTCTFFIQVNEDAPIEIDKATFPLSASNLTDRTILKTFSNHIVNVGNVNEGDDIRTFFRWEGLAQSAGVNPQLDQIEFEPYTTNTAFGSVEFFSFEFRQETVTDDSRCDIMLIWEYFVRLFQAATGLEDPLRSTLLGRTDGELFTYPQDGEFSLIGVTIGSQIRGIPLTEKPIVAQIEESFKALNSLTPIGIGYENGKFVIEKLEYFFNSNEIGLNLTNVKDIEEAPAKEWLFNEIKVGDKNYETEETGNKLSPNAPKTYSIRVENVKGKYDIENPFITNGAVIENVRRDREIQEGKDNRYDNTIVFISLLRDGFTYRPEAGSDLLAVSNVENGDSMYNLRFAPAKRIRNHLPFISSGIYRDTLSDRIRFVSGKGNTEAQIRIDVNDTLDTENQNYAAVFPIFEATEYRFKKEVEEKDFSVLKELKGNITATNASGENVVGFLDVGDQENDDQNEVEFRLLKRFSV